MASPEITSPCYPTDKKRALLLHLLCRQPGYDRGDTAVRTKTTASYENACKAFRAGQAQSLADCPDRGRARLAAHRSSAK